MLLPSFQENITCPRVGGNVSFLPVPQCGCDEGSCCRERVLLLFLILQRAALMEWEAWAGPAPGSAGLSQAAALFWSDKPQQLTCSHSCLSAERRLLLAISVTRSQSVGCLVFVLL